MLYADVCVNTPLGAREPTDHDPLGQTFTYAVPERLAGRLEPGHLIWVPFRGRQLQAVVLRVHEEAPDFDTREIHSLVWAQPLLNPAQLALAHWLADYYLAPLIEAVRLMLPAGLSRRGRTVYVRTSRSKPEDLTPTQAALLERIGEVEGEWSEVSAGLKVTQKVDLEPLVARGLVTREVAFPTPPPRPKMDRLVRLLADDAAVTRALPSLGRDSKPADALAWLAARPADQPLPTRSDVQTGAGVSPAAFETLINRGWAVLESPEPGSTRLRKSDARVRLALPQGSVTEALVTLRAAEKHRAVLEMLQRQDGAAWIGRVYAETGATLDTLRDLEAAGLVTLAEEMIWRDPLAGQTFAPDRPPVLTADQEAAWGEVRQSIELAGADHGPGAFLLHGVTGSGKTEIYLRALEETLRRGRQAVALVPEIALTPQTIRRFAARFPGKVTVWHSELGEGERFDVWRRVRTNHPAAQVVVGSRSALFLPFPDLGLIVLDEEHEPSYKQERTPRYHARTVALELGRLCQAPVLLGSATPALESYYAARRGALRLLALPQRVLGHADPQNSLFPPQMAAELPQVRIVDMRQELRAGNRSMFSRALSQGIARVLAAGQQAMLYLNRRGAATFVMCRDCGHVEACTRCATPLTLHSGASYLLCHHCNRRYPVPATCPDCASRRIRFFGGGVETVEEAIRLEFPQARTLRWDRDVTGAKGSHDAILAKFIAHEADVLIGTQMIAKGLDLPLVTLVGVVAADMGLFLPDFRSAERTFQLLTQVAGRAGRSALGGDVIVQTYHPEHYAIVAAGRHDYEGFYRQEMGFRREQGYPPLRRLARLVYHHTRRETAQVAAATMAEWLREEIERRGSEDVTLIGPSPCFFSRQRGEYRWQVIVCADDPATLVRGAPTGLGWRVDIDPVDLL
jgi:primosomal protein N' (replication factor Y)